MKLIYLGSLDAIRRVMSSLLVKVCSFNRHRELKQDIFTAGMITYTNNAISSY
jgi:hypothetical protein